MCPSLALSSPAGFLSSAAYKYRRISAAMHWCVLWCAPDHRENCNRRSFAVGWLCQRKDAQGQSFQCCSGGARAFQNRWRRHLPENNSKTNQPKKAMERFRMEGVLRSSEQPPAQSRAGSNASCSGFFCSEEFFSPNLPSWKFCVCESPLLCCAIPGFFMTTLKPLLEGQSPTSRRQRSGLRDGRIAEHSFLKKDFVSGWLWPLC